MQSTLDRKVIYLMLRAARRQEAERRPNAGRAPPQAEPAPCPPASPGTRWWLNAPQPTQPPRRSPARGSCAANDSDNFSAKVTADE